MRNLFRKLKRAIRRRQPDIIAVKCPTCDSMMNAYTRHYCPEAVIVDSRIVR